MAAASQILGWVQQIFDQKGIHYKLFEKDYVIKTNFPLKCKLKDIDVIYIFKEDSFGVYATIALSADKDCRQKVAEYITRANYGIRYGNFEMDFDDGDIRYHLNVDCTDRISLSEKMVMRTICIPMQMFDRYGDGLVAVMFGIKSPEDAIKEAEND